MITPSRRGCARPLRSTLVASVPVEVGMSGRPCGDTQDRGERIQAAEREEAKRRLLAQAEEDRIPAEETTRAVPERRWCRGTE